MEHRYNERKPTNMSVMVSCPRVGMFRGKALNLSLGGMHVQSEYVVMPLHAPVVVSLQPDPAIPHQYLQVPGMVIHQRGNGFGLMFGELDPASSDGLRTLLLELSVPFAVNA